MFWQHKPCPKLLFGSRNIQFFDVFENILESSQWLNNSTLILYKLHNFTFKHLKTFWKKSIRIFQNGQRKPCPIFKTSRKFLQKVICDWHAVKTNFWQKVAKHKNRCINSENGCPTKPHTFYQKRTRLTFQKSFKIQYYKA